MQEIIPHIENTWESYCTDKTISFTKFDVDKLDTKKLLQAAMKASHIIVTAFNHEIRRTLSILRDKIGLDTPFIFYIHGFSSMGCWPLLEMGGDAIFKKRDIFISTSTKDLKQLTLSSTHKTFCIPFGLDKPSHEKNLSEASTMEGCSFYFVGRISEQKNLHSLIYSIFLLKKVKPDIKFNLDIFGKEDNLGSPNMGKPSTDYLKFLKSLVHKLELTNNITFHGFVKREKIQDHLDFDRKIFISPSLHSDENFGMAALRALNLGHEAVLSDWGGHHDFPKYYNGLVQLVPTYICSSGPVLNPIELTDHLVRLISIKKTSNHSLEESYYTHNSIKKKLSKVLETNSLDGHFSKLAKSIFKNKKEFQDLLPKEQKSYSTKIFSSYEDPSNLELMRAYASKDDYIVFQDSASIIPPWVRIDNNNLIIEDPHRKISKYPYENGNMLIYSYDGKEISLSNELYDLLVKNGYCFNVHRDFLEN